MKFLLRFILFIFLISTGLSILRFQRSSKSFLEWEWQGEARAANDGMQEFDTNRTGWRMRGKHWLKKNLGLVLTVDRPRVNGAGEYELVIHPVSKLMSCNASKLELWVRIGGPDMFAGSAIPHATACSWTFPFQLERVGEYIVEAKLLMYNGLANVHPTNINYTVGNVSMAESTAVLPIGSTHEDFIGNKMYSSYTACCEVCTRVPGCILWAFPTADNLDGCQLFFDDSKSSVVQMQTRMLATEHETRRRLLRAEPAFGWPRDEETSYFLGCGWSFWLTSEFPCEDPTTDDMIGNFTFIHDVEKNLRTNSIESRPICTTADETLEKAKGRWVRHPYPNATQCPDEIMVKGESFNEDMVKFDPLQPTCWYRDDLTKHGAYCIEGGCSEWLPSAWESWLHQETHFYGTWEPYDCRYNHLTNPQLQKCIIAKNISNIRVEGMSIMNIVKDYLAVRLEDIVFVNATDTTVEVTLDTIKFPHLLWHYSMDECATQLRELKDSNPLRPRYWMTGFYLTSEREEFVTNGRSRMLVELAETILVQEKGWIELNMYDMSAAFMYDTTGQKDGLHLIGPPMKMLITKFFSHLCDGVV